MSADRVRSPYPLSMVGSARCWISTAAHLSVAMPVHSACATLLPSASTVRLLPSSASAYQPRSGSQNRSWKALRRPAAVARQAAAPVVSPSSVSARYARARYAA